MPTKNNDAKHRAVLRRLAAIEKRLTTIERKLQPPPRQRQGCQRVAIGGYLRAKRPGLP